MLHLLTIFCLNPGRVAYRSLGKVIVISTAILFCCSVGFTQTPSDLDNASQLNVTTFATNASAGFRDPFHISIHSGYAFVTDSMDSVIRKISLTTGTSTTLAGQSGGFGATDGVGSAASFGLPAGVWADNNYIYVTDGYFDVIRRVSVASGDVVTLAGAANAPSGFADGTGSAARFQGPIGIWGDGTNLYVCDSLNFTIRKIVISTGAVTTLAGTARSRGAKDGVGSAATFYAPAGIWGDGIYLYVADGSSIRKVAISTGAVTTLSGTPNASGYADGTASQARFDFISSIWGDGVNLFAVDSGNSVLRKISLQNGLVTTIAGLPDTAGNVDGFGSAARFNEPTGVAGNGTTLYIVDRMNLNVRMATPPSPPAAASGGATTSTDPSGSTNPTSGSSTATGTSGTGIVTSEPRYETTGSGSSGSGTDDKRAYGNRDLWYGDYRKRRFRRFFRWWIEFDGRRDVQRWHCRHCRRLRRLQRAPITSSILSCKIAHGPHRLRRAKATEFRPAMPGSSLLMARLLLRAWPSLAIAAMASWSRKRRFRSRNGSNRDESRRNSMGWSIRGSRSPIQTGE